jgi:hypothetical protein
MTAERESSLEPMHIQASKVTLKKSESTAGISSGMQADISSDRRKMSGLVKQQSEVNLASRQPPTIHIKTASNAVNQLTRIRNKSQESTSSEQPRSAVPNSYTQKTKILPYGFQVNQGPADKNSKVQQHRQLLAMRMNSDLGEVKPQPPPQQQ